MLEHLNKDQTKQERRKLLSDVVYVIFHDILKRWKEENVTSYSPVELFLSAKEMAQIILSMPDIMEGLEEEIEDLESDVEGENDAMIIMVLTSSILKAINSHSVGIDMDKIIVNILQRYIDYPLFNTLLEEGCKKEQKRWLEGKKTNLLSYELEEIEERGEGEEAIKQLFEYFIGIADIFDKDTINANLLLLNKYNIDHGNIYSKELNALYQTLKENKLPSMNDNNGIVAGGDVKVTLQLPNEQLEQLLEKKQLKISNK